MLSHDSIVIGAREISALHRFKPAEERIVSYLPLSHIAGMMFDIYYPIANASTLCFADSNALKGTLVENLKYYKPTRFLGVPRVWEKMEEKIKIAGKDTRVFQQPSPFLVSAEPQFCLLNTGACLWCLGDDF